MRPVHLLIEGLRSFRAPVSIDFEGRSHIAVVGDTGAGKSSILEAMMYALYGKATFGGSNQELMNDTSTQLRVVLRFRVSGEEWEVARVVRRSSRGDVGAARAQLVHLGADGEPLEKVEQVRVVNDRVTGLIGLDSDAFLRTVVLPQGRFAQLLVEDKPAERSRILRQVWRTDELEQMGRLAGEKMGDIRQLRARLEQAGDEHPPDPAGHLEALEGAAAAASKESDTEAATANAAKAARDTLLASERALRSAKAVAERIRPGEIDRLAGQLTPVEDVMQRIEEEDGRLAQSEEGFRAALAGIPTDDGPAHEDVAAARAGLNDVAGLAERAVAMAGVLREAIGAASESRTRSETAEAESARAEKVLVDHDAGRPLLTEAADTARRNLERIERQYDACADHKRGVAAAREKLDAARREQAELATRLDIAMKQEGGARAAADAADAVHAEARRANSAAAAAHGLHPGDDCPICRRDLPAAWTAPGDGGLDDAKQAAGEAGALAREAGMRVAGLTAEQQGGEKRLRELGDALSAARDALREGLEALGQGGPGTDDLDAPLPEPASLLGSLEAALREAIARVDAHDRVRDDLADRARYAGRAAATAREAGRGDSKRAHDTRQAATSVLGDLTRKIGSIPVPFRPRLPLPADPLDLQTVDTSPVDAALGVAKARHHQLTERDSLRAMLRGQIDHVLKSRADLVQRRTDEVDGPLGSVVRELSEQRYQLGGAIRELECGVAVPAPVPASEPGPLRRWIDGLRTAMTDVLRAADQQCTDASRDADAARTALLEIAHRFDMDPDDPDSLVRTAENAANNARYRARRATELRDAFAEIVDEVIRLRTQTEEVVAMERVLGDLDAALKPGAFLKWLTLRRSRELLVHASRMLGEMTGGKYAFVDPGEAEDQWRVLDQDSGQPRSPASLSGGEQFIGSLALALGMVEMMARSGGRLESLFLDEGFGSLDRHNLDAALEALASVAARGRMVGVISHVRAVAEQIDDVLAVTRGAAGSRVAWLSSAQRRRLSRSDAGWEAAGALEGLLD
ncbi:MAG: SMC family ATPase [Gemmatimonadetes bacterium]|nr:SMC family ATPase [Gemmatimonadota bacterium]